ncbi:unnamed protein product [Linum trigynum]|uniref:Uncharacterized protein n=1 Tax=Linum trigynum TaxID=586398 RepID=A0AAV2ESN3_9ROSI
MLTALPLSKNPISIFFSLFEERNFHLRSNFCLTAPQLALTISVPARPRQNQNQSRPCKSRPQLLCQAPHQPRHHPHQSRLPRLAASILRLFTIRPLLAEYGESVGSPPQRHPPSTLAGLE